MHSRYIMILTIAWLASFIMTPVMRFVGARMGLLDHPQERKLQRNAIPRTGGLGVLCGLIAGLWFLSVTSGELGIPFSRQMIAILLGGALIHIVGVLDDGFDIPARWKLAGQVAAVSLVMSQGVLIDAIRIPGAFSFDLGFFAYPLTAFFLLGFINSFNLVDGLDGLASGIAAIGALCLAICGVLTGNAVLAGACIALLGAVVGFLPFNFILGKTFLGDAGSMILGYLLPVFAIEGARFAADSTPVILAVACALVPILDTATTILRRVRNGQGIFAPDSMHIHHRLIRYGLTPERTVAMILAATAFLAGQALCALVVEARPLFIPTALAGLLVVLGLRTDRRRVVDDQDASFREILFYLLGTQDGNGRRWDGKSGISELASPGHREVRSRGASATPTQEIGAPREAPESTITSSES